MYLTFVIRRSRGFSTIRFTSLMNWVAARAITPAMNKVLPILIIASTVLRRYMLYTHTNSKLLNEENREVT